METRRKAQSWFASLRRDGRLFVALATLLLLLAGFQTTSVANASSFVICTSDGATHGPLQPLDHKDCAHCLSTNACGGYSVVGKLLPSGGLAVLSRVPATGFASITRLAAGAPTITGGPPGIRAPPLSA